MDIASMFLNSQVQFTALKDVQLSLDSTVKSETSFDTQLEKCKSNVKADEVNNELVKVRKSEQTPKDTPEVVETDTNESVKGNLLKEKNIAENEKVKTVDKNERETVKTETEEKMLKAIAEKTGKTEDEIIQILQELNMTVFDLVIPQKLNVFMQELLQVQEPAELLLLSDAQEMYKGISEIISEYKEIIEQYNLIEKPFGENLSEQSEIISIASAKTNEKHSEGNSSLNEEFEIIKDVSIKEIDITKVTSNAQMGKENQQSSFEQSTGQSFVAQQTVNVTSDTLATVTTVGNLLQELDQAGNVVRTVSSQTAQISTSEIIEQIVEQIKVDVSADVSEMKILLKPDTLGELTLKITTHNNIVAAQFVAESQQVKEVLEANLGSLKDTLQQLGLVVDELAVSVEQKNSEAKQHYEQNRNKSRRRINQIINDIAQDLESENAVTLQDISESQVDIRV